VDPEGGKKECRDVRKWGPEGKYVKPPTGTGKRKLLAGQIVGNPLKSQRVPTLTLEDRLMNRLDAPKKKQRAEEEEAEEKMLKYVDNVKDHNIVGVEAIVARCYNSQRQLTAEQSADRRDLFSCLSEVGMTVMISIYCSRGAQFGAAYVKTELKDIGVLKLDCHKIYTWLQELRSAACAEDVSSSMASSFAAPETTVLVHEINSQEVDSSFSSYTSLSMDTGFNSGTYFMTEKAKADAEEVSIYLFIYYIRTSSNQPLPLYNPAPSAGFVPFKINAPIAAAGHV
jgi:hypothetical protein